MRHNLISFELRLSLRKDVGNVKMPEIKSEIKEEVPDFEGMELLDLQKDLDRKPLQNAIPTDGKIAKRLQHNGPKILRCEDKNCPFSTSDVWKLQRHFAHKHSEKNYHSKYKYQRCPRCPKFLKNREQFQIHVDNCQGPRKDRVKCDLCEKDFVNKESLEGHKFRMHTEKYEQDLLQCDICDFTSFCKTSLHVHIKRIHMNLKPNKCTYCDFASYSKTQLNEHTRRKHLKQKPFKCDVCDYASSDKEHLKAHVISKHTEREKSWQCEECDRKFVSKLSLRTHVKMCHKKEYEFFCDLCDYKAFGKLRMETHKNAIHRHVKPHKCAKCDFATASKGSLARHVKVQHEIGQRKTKEYACDACDFRTNYLSSLNRHKTQQHTSKLIVNMIWKKTIKIFCIATESLHLFVTGVPIVVHVSCHSKRDYLTVLPPKNECPSFQFSLSRSVSLVLINAIVTTQFCRENNGGSYKNRGQRWTHWGSF